MESVSLSRGRLSGWSMSVVPLSTVCLAHGLQVSPDYVDPSSGEESFLFIAIPLLCTGFYDCLNDGHGK